MPLAYNNQRAPKSGSAIFPVSEIFGKTIYPALVLAIGVTSGAQVGICLFLSFERVRMWPSPKLSIAILLRALRSSFRDPSDPHTSRHEAEHFVCHFSRV